MLYMNTKSMVRSPDGDTELFDVTSGVLQGDTLAPYLFVICLDYVLTLFCGGILTSYSGGGKITSPILTAVIVVQLSSNLVRISNCQSVLNILKKNQNLSPFDDVITIFWKKDLEFFFFFLEMIFKRKTIFLFFLMT